MSAWTQCWEGSFTNGLDKFAPKIRGSLRQYSSCEEVDGGAVLNVRYPAGTTSPKADKPGGANYYCYCFGNEPIGESMKLEYELFLCPDW